ncbi:MAG: hypothetical protein IPM78_01485 [Moraxellaceae bacterium]|nr:hypothetical protein [Moraxellaceae bacterium]
MAYVLTQRKKYDNARLLIEKVLAMYPEDIGALAQYAALFAVQGQFDKATTHYSSVLILDPENVSANYYFSAPAAKK